MGLDLIFYSNVEKVESVHINGDEIPVEDLEEEFMWECGYIRIGYSEFPEHLNGLEPGWYTSEDSFGFRAGSYGYYNHWRKTLCNIIHNIEPEVIWGNPELYRGKPFVELIDFSDCSGVIGPVVIKKLIEDFENFRDFVAERRLVESYRGENSWMEDYDMWIKGLLFAKNNGIIVFC